MDDAELVRQTLAGRTEAYAHLADDLAQETLLRGFRALHTLSDHAKFGPWLMGIAARAALDWLKAKERTTRPFSTLGIDESYERSNNKQPDEAAFQAEERRLVLAEIEA